MTYQEFIKSKERTIHKGGFTPLDLNKNLFPFQRFIVTNALNHGKYAIFSECGTGKTLMQLEWANQVSKHENKPVLILAPLAVSGQTIQEASKFGLFCEKLIGDVFGVGVYITNYEQLDNIDADQFCGVVLDESSILKNFSGKNRTKLINSFSVHKYKLACTATPSPNDPMELGNHAEFLDIMAYQEMLAMYFVHDGGATAKWRIKGHAIHRFYGWVSKWAVMLSNPADIGFDGSNFILPELHFIEKQIKTKKRDNGLLFNNTAVSATDFNRELRITKIERLDNVAQIVNDSDEPFIIWINQNEEESMICNLIPDAVPVRGSDKPERKEEKLLGFANGDFRVLVTKKKIAQFGLNYQHCNNQVFASLDFSFEGLYQAIRRSYRFGQNKDVNIYMITTDTMQNVIQSINRKQKQFNTMRENMNKAMNDSSAKIEYETNEITTDLYHIKRGDCIDLIKETPDESIGFSVFSPPFADLYTYSDSLEDMGNSSGYKQFLIQFQFLVNELYRVIKSGRNVAVHCMDLPIQKGKEGFIGLRDFSGMILNAFNKSGFIYHSRVTIWKNPVTEMQRTKALGLLHKQIKKDSTMSRVGIPDYVMVFRKDGERNDPVTNTDLSVDLWQKYASPVWMDIDYGDTLNYRSGRSEKDEKHICPLQLGTIERLIHLYTNKGDSVLTPFMGIGSEVYKAVEMDRFGIGFELKESYYNLAIKNINSACLKKRQAILF